MKPQWTKPINRSGRPKLQKRIQLFWNNSSGVEQGQKWRTRSLLGKARVNQTWSCFRREKHAWSCFRGRNMLGAASHGGTCLELPQREEHAWSCFRREKHAWSCFRGRNMLGAASGGGTCLELLQGEKHAWSCFRGRNMLGAASGGGTCLELLQGEKHAWSCFRGRNMLGAASGGETCLELLQGEEHAWSCFRGRNMLGAASGGGTCLQLLQGEKHACSCVRGRNMLAAVSEGRNMLAAASQGETCLELLQDKQGAAGLALLQDKQGETGSSCFRTKRVKEGWCCFRTKKVKQARAASRQCFRTKRMKQSRAASGQRGWNRARSVWGRTERLEQTGWNRDTRQLTKDARAEVVLHSQEGAQSGSQNVCSILAVWWYVPTPCGKDLPRSQPQLDPCRLPDGTGRPDWQMGWSDSQPGTGSTHYSILEETGTTAVTLATLFPPFITAMNTQDIQNMFYGCIFGKSKILSWMGESFRLALLFDLWDYHRANRK